MTATPISELQSANPSAILELFEIQLNKTQHGVDTLYRFHAGTNEVNNGNVIWDGNSYTRIPIEATGFEITGKGTLPRPTIRVSNLLGTLTGIIQALPNGLEGAKVTRIRTMARFLDAANFDGGTNPYGTPDSTQKLPDEIYFVDRLTGENRDIVEFELASSLDLQGVVAPKRQTIQNVCQWKYRTDGVIYVDADYVENQITYIIDDYNYDKVDCPYKGGLFFKADDTPTLVSSEDQCGKRLSSCKKRFGFVEMTGSVTKDSAVLTIDSGQADELALVDVASGPLIAGFGIPDGTTVLAKDASTITLSAVADGTQSVVESGQITANGLTIKMTNNPVTQGIKAGMTVSGPFVPSGTVVTQVQGSKKLVFLSIENNLEILELNFPEGYVEYAGDPYVDTDYVTTDYFNDIEANVYVETNYILDSIEGTYTDSTKKLTVASTGTAAKNDIVLGPDILLNTKIKTNPSATQITLNKNQPIEDGTTTSFGVYKKATTGFVPYTFEASDVYVVRPVAGLPFGSFPGVGKFR